MPSFFWTPHSGYHGHHVKGRFFEGWYLRLTLPAHHETFAFMYSIDDPDGQSLLSGGAAQVLGPGEQYLFSSLPQVNRFWAWRHRLGLGHWGQYLHNAPRTQYLPAEDFKAVVQRGYQATATHHQGCIEDMETGAIARWNYAVKPIYGWGPPQSISLATAEWLSYFPIFEPGWQVLMAHGLATGWAEWQGERYDFEDAPAYAEKNWGGAFPERWFWIQANAFEDSDLTITAAGGRRQILGQFETVGLVGLHFQGRFITLSSLKSSMAWRVEPWGVWRVALQNYRYRIVLQGTAAAPPSQVRVPTLEGLKFQCWDTTHGRLRVQVWERSPLLAPSDSLILDVSTDLAGLEVGGRGWENLWEFSRVR
ncbi:tocopherol cyclase family protein [Oscillatoria sp. CS-180]|uniref:tocopherol cyclase family protein n=1 Tax=Oscillatoria sp. CS-180 TaxID=3021720 RepID=UPI00232BA5AE|nr:tocopherol cyclase family protein [Oscillatoria sp. CS-180]MDB9525533.1 tocopherol cyclase family protein [Oscillatoria sp. CS-180]